MGKDSSLRRTWVYGVGKAEVAGDHCHACGRRPPDNQVVPLHFYRVSFLAFALKIDRRFESLLAVAVVRFREDRTASVSARARSVSVVHLLSKLYRPTRQTMSARILGAPSHSRSPWRSHIARDCTGHCRGTARVSGGEVRVRGLETP